MIQEARREFKIKMKQSVFFGDSLSDKMSIKAKY